MKHKAATTASLKIYSLWSQQDDKKTEFNSYVCEKFYIWIVDSK